MLKCRQTRFRERASMFNEIAASMRDSGSNGRGGGGGGNERRENETLIRVAKAQGSNF